MYRIQAWNFKKNFWTVQECHTMEERQAFIKKCLDSGEYGMGGISWEWLARGYD